LVGVLDLLAKRGEIGPRGDLHELVETGGACRLDPGTVLRAALGFGQFFEINASRFLAEPFQANPSLLPLNFGGAQTGLFALTLLGERGASLCVGLRVSEA
jgi:hypothetical protein